MWGFGDVRVRSASAIDQAAGLRAIDARASVDSNSERRSLRCASLLRPAEGCGTSWSRRHGWRRETRKRGDHSDPEDSFSLDHTVVGVFGYGPIWPSAFLIIILLFSSAYQVPYKHTHCAPSSVVWKETIMNRP